MMMMMIVMMMGHCGRLGHRWGHGFLFLFPWNLFISPHQNNGSGGAGDHRTRRVFYADAAGEPRRRNWNIGAVCCGVRSALKRGRSLRIKQPDQARLKEPPKTSKEEIW